MPVHNATIEAIFDEIADLLDIQGANPFRVRAYRNAARTIGDLGTDITTLMGQGTALTEIPGIGADLAKKIEEIVSTGKSEFLERLQGVVETRTQELIAAATGEPLRASVLVPAPDELARAAAAQAA